MFIDLTGKRYGKLQVLNKSDIRTKYWEICWNCLCDCGNCVVIPGFKLRNGNKTNCGCEKKTKRRKLAEETLQKYKERGKELSKYLITHNKTKTRLYNVWNSMKQRCNNPNVKYYRVYGGRGIKVCKEWQNDFLAFHDWAMENGYNTEAKRGECTIDRIDNDKGYEPSNCRWVTNLENQRNKRKISKRTKESRGENGA